MQYQVECWRKWQQFEAVVPPAVAEVEEGRAATLPEGNHMIRLEEDNVEGQSQFFEAYRSIINYSHLVSVTSQKHGLGLAIMAV